MLLRWQKVKNTELIKSINHKVNDIQKVTFQALIPRSDQQLARVWQLRGTSTPTIGNLWKMNLVFKFESRDFHLASIIKLGSF